MGVFCKVNRTTAILAASILATTLSACGSNNLFSRDRPDEFAVSRQAPLVVPPDFSRDAVVHYVQHEWALSLTDVFAATEFRAFQADSVKGIRWPGQAELGRGRLDALIDRAKQLGAAGLVWVKVREGGALESPTVTSLRLTETRPVSCSGV